MLTRSYLRNKYGEGYLSIIDDRTTITWKPLSIGDFIKYETIAQQDNIIPEVIEDEIFKKCVLNKQILDDIDSLPAGTISIVVQNIMEVSGPLSFDHFNNLLENKRVLAQQPLHLLVPYIIKAFPSYTPEAVYGLPFDLFMMRLAQAELFLIENKFLPQPFQLTDPNKPKEKKRRVNLDNAPAELKAIWEKQQKPSTTTKPKTQSTKDKESKPVTIDPKTSPIFKDNGDIKVNKSLNQDRKETEQAVGSEDEDGLRALLINDAQRIYKPLIDKLPFYQKK